VTRRSVTALALLPALLMLCACAGLGLDQDENSKAAEIVAGRSTVEFTVPAKGYLEALSASPVAVPRVPTGALKVKELVPEGSLVSPGDVVIVFDDSALNIELDNHRASFRSTDRQIDGNDLQARIASGGIEIMRRVAEMERDHVVNFGNLDDAIFSRVEILETEVRKDEAEETIVFADASLQLRGEYYDIEERILDVAKNQVSGKLERVETSLGSLILKAPIPGLIVYKKNWRGASVGVGDTLWPGNVLMSIVDPDSTALTAFVLEKDSAGVEVGAEAKIVVDARPEMTFSGRVKTVAEVSRPIERGSPVKYAEVQIEIDIDDPGLLKPGMKAEARIRIGGVEDSVVIPRMALRGESDAHWVLVAKAGGGTRRQSVQTGAGDRVRVSILEGLDGGERLLIGGDDPAETTENT
jgi:HlyD family secretion protein